MASALEYELQVKNLIHKSSERFAQERPEQSRNQSGFKFLLRPWTPVEILTTCVMFFEMFGWVSTILAKNAAWSKTPKK